MNDDIHALSGAYAVDAVDDVERARFEAHLAGCEACQAEVASLRAAAAELSALSDEAPPASLKARVMADIRTVRPLPPLAATSSPATSSPAASSPAGPVGTASVPGGPAADHDEAGTRPDVADGPDGDASPPTTRQADGGATIVPLAGRRRRTWSGLVAAAAALVLVLGGVTVWRSTTTDPNQAIADRVLAAADATRTTQNLPNGARATVVRSESLRKAVLVTSGLPAAPSDRVYQLWLQDPTGHFASAGLVPQDGGADQVVVLDGDASRSTGAGITVEPAGGSDQPTTKPLALFAFA